MNPLPRLARLRPELWLWGVVGAGVLLRLVHLAFVINQPFVSRLAMDSLEYDRWAMTLVGGAWRPEEPFFQAPLYPYLLAALYRLFGHHLVVIYGAQILAAGAGLWALGKAGARLGGPTLGLAAAAAGALYAPFLFYDVQLLKESLAVTTVCFLLWRWLMANECPTARNWAGVGALAGVLTLLRENALLVVPFLLLWALRPAMSSNSERARLVRFGAGLAGFALVLLPSALHNATTGGGFLPTTFQGGVNFYIGNNPKADGGYQPIAVGKQVPFHERREPIRIAEQETGRKLTAAEVSRHWLGKSLAWARVEPKAFLRLQLKKLALFWSWYEHPDAIDYYHFRLLSPVLRLPLLEFGGVSILALVGLWLARRRLGAFAPAWLFALLWMVSTVAFFLFARYRLPVVPALLLLAALPLVEFGQALRRIERRRALLWGALVAAAWLAPRAVSFEPRWDLVHYNLGRLYDDAGETGQAAEHYREAVKMNPNDFLSCLNLGNQAARSRRFAEAKQWFERALAIEPKFDDGWANLGGAELALGNLDAAIAAFDRALALNPKNTSALHNRAVLAARRGDRDGARRLVEQLLAIDASHEAALKLRARLEAPD